MEEPPVGNPDREVQATRDRVPTGFVHSRRALLSLYTVVALLFWMCLYLYAPTLPTYTKTKTGSLAAAAKDLMSGTLRSSINGFPGTA